jgi:ABC-type nitrate/sulfonate/bicarbonate transport system substrate-binding protein
VSSTRRRLKTATSTLATVAAALALAACSSSAAATKTADSGTPTTSGSATSSAASGTSSGAASVAASSGAASVAASSAPASAVPTLDPTHPTTVHVADAGVSNLLAIAKGQSFFSKNGLDVELTQTNSGVATLAALQGGSLQIGYADLYAGINAISNGFDVRLVENNNANPAKIPFLVKSGGSIKSVADLAGKKIGVAPVPQITVNAKGFLKANGLDPNSVTYTVVSDANGAPQALNRGDYAAWEASPISVDTNNGKAGYNFTTIGNDDTAGWSNPNATTAGWWSTGSYANSHPAVEYAWAKSVRQFRTWWQAQPDAQKAALVKQYYQVDYVALAAGDQAKLADLIDYIPFQSGPIDLQATQSWYDLGLQYAGDKIAKNVDWKKYVFGSALQATPGV